MYGVYSKENIQRLVRMEVLGANLQINQPQRKAAEVICYPTSEMYSSLAVGVSGDLDHSTFGHFAPSKS